MPAETALTIDELADRVGMTVRNLREWRTLGLLPKAEMRGRVGFYPPDVVARIERVRRLHSAGFTLELIGRMLDASGDAVDEVIRLAGTLRAPATVETASGEAHAERLARLRGSLERIGLPEEAALEALGQIREHAEDMAQIFERVWMEQIWEPFVAAGRPDAELERIQETAAEVKPLAMEAVVAVFAAAMDAQIERGIAREMTRDGQ
jgi:DNA-binding transcriptional MerR regulator